MRPLQVDNCQFLAAVVNFATNPHHTNSHHKPRRSTFRLAMSGGRDGEDTVVSGGSRLTGCAEGEAGWAR